MIPHDMQSLIDAFPSLREKGMRWKVQGKGDSSLEFIAQLPGLSSGERHAAAFVLHVWDSHARTPGNIEFNLADAMSIWDEKHRSAFLRWAHNPWFA
jgi:hypothetical protein